MSSEIRHITYEEMLMDQDEDYGQEYEDEEYDEVCHNYEEYWADEYRTLRSLGLNHKQAIEVLNNE